VTQTIRNHPIRQMILFLYVIIRAKLFTLPCGPF
jgi:hypothetical protein